MSKVAVVTGGVGALGRAVCRWFDAHGYELYLSAISDAEKTAYDGPGTVSVVDLLSVAECAAWIGEMPAEIHAAALIAGGFSMQPISGLGDAHTQKMISLNYLTASNALSALAAKLSSAESSSVVLVGSQASDGAAGMAAYAASKAAVLSLANSAAAELKEQDVRVNTILPDIIDTPANRAAMPNADFEKWQKPEEIAEVIGFLCSDSAKIISGNSLKLSR